MLEQIDQRYRARCAATDVTVISMAWKRESVQPDNLVLLQ